MSLVEIWPLFGIRVRTASVELFVPREEADLAEAAQLAAGGIYDPQNHFLPRTPVAGWTDSEPREAERQFLRYYWAALADWRPEKWNLLLAARIGERIIGVQEVGAQGFAVARTVSTGSWVGRAYQRVGHGKAMREAVLHFAFAGLSAARADSSAWSVNEPSLATSRALGYQPNGTSTRAVDSRCVEQINVSLRRSEWTMEPAGAAISGLTAAACLLFGCAATPIK
jgi:RimJ/RimL family protein N-acetyltransferase